MKSYSLWSRAATSSRYRSLEHQSFIAIDNRHFAAESPHGLGKLYFYVATADNEQGFGGSYTYSKAIDEATDFNSDFGPVDQTDLAGERGQSAFDQRHKVVLAAI
jgi:hypothetical protein